MIQDKDNISYEEFMEIFERWCREQPDIEIQNKNPETVFNY